MSIDLNDPTLYLNRELSWLEFNFRVLQEALDETNWPLLERLKFLSIFSTNLDEFFMIRVAGLKQQIDVGVHEKSSDKISPEQQLLMISKRIREGLDLQMKCLNKDILPKLAAEDIAILSYKKLNVAQKKHLERVFKMDIFPVVTPLGFDPGRPFPHLLNVSLYIAFYVNDPQRPEEPAKFAIVQIPTILPRLIPAPTEKGDHFVLLEDVICANASRLFLGHEVLEWYPFRITRDCDMEIAEDEADDLLETIHIEVKKRRWGKAVRLAVMRKTPKKLRDLLASSLNLTEMDVYEIDGPLNMPDLMALYKLDRPKLKDQSFKPRITAALQKHESIFDAIRAEDVLIHNPYESFDSVIEFIQSAAEDPKVQAIKMTLYRTGSDSPIISALSVAAENGKQVAVLVELKARFDEENNIVWARTLAKAGVHVVYGLVGLKTHCKIALVVRREADGIRRYVHLSTGNYNPTSARIYTDLGLMTCDYDFAEDASHIFNYLTGYSHRRKWRKLLVAPMTLREELNQLIQTEIALHQKHGGGHIILKMNSLLDSEMVRNLYLASQAGVKVELIVRGICSLRPAMPGVSDNISVRSIVGRFLEHSRIFYFRHNGGDKIFLGSADWMPRNLDRRVELLFPIERRELKERLLNILNLYLQDNAKAYRLEPDGSYQKIIPAVGQTRLSAQEILFVSP